MLFIMKSCLKLLFLNTLNFKQNFSLIKLNSCLISLLPKLVANLISIHFLLLTKNFWQTKIMLNSTDVLYVYPVVVSHFLYLLVSLIFVVGMQLSCQHNLGNSIFFQNNYKLLIKRNVTNYWIYIKLVNPWETCFFYATFGIALLWSKQLKPLHSLLHSFHLHAFNCTSNWRK